MPDDQARHQQVSPEILERVDIIMRMALLPEMTGPYGPRGQQRSQLHANPDLDAALFHYDIDNLELMYVIVPRLIGFCRQTSRLMDAKGSHEAKDGLTSSHSMNAFA